MCDRKQKGWKEKLSGYDVILTSLEWILLTLAACVDTTGQHRPLETETLLRYACFNTIFEITCPAHEIILFESARYGRNDSLGAVTCDAPFTRSCDVDVQYSLSRACGGKRRCSIAVNTAFFGDPCGYEEFLKVVYRCLPTANIYRRCPDSSRSLYFDRGYLASPNYPGKYYLDVECRWHLAVQPQQQVRVTLYDFELDVKRGGTCHDFLDISTGNRTYFRECGTLGKQVIEVGSSGVVVWFRTGLTSLTQRGFILYLEGLGKGCDLSTAGQHDESSRIFYYLEGGELVANVTCSSDYRTPDGEPASRLLRCVNNSWSDQPPRCLPKVEETTLSDQMSYNSTSTEGFTVPFYGVFLGVVASVSLLMSLFTILAVCCHRRQRLTRRKRDDWRVVVNNLQDNVINDFTKVIGPLRAQDDPDDFKCHVKLSHACAKRHNTKRYRANDDVISNRNLLFASRDVNEDDDDAKRRHMMFGARKDDVIARCAICQSLTRTIGSYVGFPAPCPSSLDEGTIMVRSGPPIQRRAQSEPQIWSNPETHCHSLPFYSTPDLTNKLPMP